MISLSVDWEKIKSDMHKDRRYAIRKAHEQSFEVTKCGAEPGHLDSFYDRYERTMDRVDGVKYPKKFFELLNRKLNSSVQLYRASVEESVVGFHMYLFDDSQSIITHLFSGVDEQDFQYYPSELIHRHVIEDGVDSDYEYYNFGETLADHEDGIFQYKQKFGGAIQPTPVWRRPVGLSGRGLHRARMSIETGGVMEPFLKRILSIVK
jgi:lipid II:glycine glycyltransferase (peptidoglycan interpeptide bridge formation enzyme)